MDLRGILFRDKNLGILLILTGARRGMKHYRQLGTNKRVVCHWLTTRRDRRNPEGWRETPREAEERRAFPVRRFLSLSFRSPNVPTAHVPRYTLYIYIHTHIHIYIERKGPFNPIGSANLCAQETPRKYPINALRGTMARCHQPWK